MKTKLNTRKREGKKSEYADFLQAKLYAWFEQNGRDLPWRRRRDAYAILVSEFMLQQTQVATVIPYFERWIQEFPTIHALAEASEQAVLSQWQGLGYYARARNLHRAAQQIVLEHGGNIPNQLDQLRTLSGIGEYTAGALMAFAFDQPVTAIDANIARVLTRFFNYDKRIDSTVGKKWLKQAARDLLPKEGGYLHTSALMELGATVCLSGKPLCLVCPLSPLCKAVQPEKLPVKGERRKAIRITEYAMWISRKDGALLLEQQTGNRRKGLWRLPQLEIRPQTDPLLALKYSIMHYQVRFEIFRESIPEKVKINQRWVAVEEVKTIPLTAPDRRAINELLKVSS